MSVRVRHLSLAPIADGRQALVLELDDAASTRLIFYGELRIEATVPPRAPTSWQMTFSAFPAEIGEHWGMMRVDPPYDEPSSFG